MLKGNDYLKNAKLSDFINLYIAHNFLSFENIDQLQSANVKLPKREFCQTKLSRQIGIEKEKFVNLIKIFITLELPDSISLIFIDMNAH